MKTAVSARKELPRIVRELNVVLTLTAREIVMAVKAPQRIFMALIWPVIMFGMFGSQLSQNMGLGMGFDFNAFMLVGMLVNALFMMTITGVITLVENKENDFTQEILVSPTSRYAIIFGKIVGSSFTGYIQFFATILIGLFIGATMTASQFWMILAISPLFCLAAGAFSMLLVGFVRNAAAAGTLSMLVSMLQMFLSGALIPVTESTGIMAILSRTLPMTYCVDFARGLFYDGTSLDKTPTLYPPEVDLMIIIAFTFVFFVAGTLNFVRQEKNK
ncbi:MAG: ABC transporter permease [Peptococcaceae bacterium]|nr:ABC transporter permease [Peptococcaceae bacterium]